MTFIKKSIEFLEAECKENKKEFGRILHSKKQMAEGLTIAGATYIGDGKFTFPDQFTKVREECKVVIFDENKNRVGKGEISEIDYIKHTITVDLEEMTNSLGKFLMVEDSNIYPSAIIKSLEKLDQDGEYPDVVKNLIARNANCKPKKESSIENIIDTVMESQEGKVIAISGPPGTGKTVCATAIISRLLKENKSILVTSNSHSAVCNLINEIKETDFKGAKISSKSKYYSKHKTIKNMNIHGKEVDGQVQGYQLLAGTCFSLSRIQDIKFDYLIIDEASQLKLSYVLSVARLAKNIILLGDHLQLGSISPIEITEHGDSVLNYVLQEHQIMPQHLGYFLNTTHRCEPQIAKVISEVFYDSKLKWSQTKNKKGITLVQSKHKLNAKMNKTEGEDVLKIYKKLLKDKVNPKDIIIIAPYNAQVSYLRSIIKEKETLIATVDSAQGLSCQFVVFSATTSAGSAEEAAFTTDARRLNVLISRARAGVFIVASEGLINSELTTPQFKQVINMIKD